MKCSIAFSCLLVGFVYAEIATEYKDVIINTHNELRRKQGGNNMNELIWNDQLAREADTWIGRCRFEHENKGRGENLAFNTNADVAANVDQSLTDWYNEINDYDYNSMRCRGVCGHYTQLVWAKTREVGCAMKRCSYLNAFGQNVKNGWIFGCWYTPKGNWVGEKPFLLGGGECSGCLEGQGCNNGLCTGEWKEKCEDRKDDCVMWAASGSCDSNKAYMERECRQSCKLCTGGAKEECKDKSSQCARYGARQCTMNKAWMVPNCMKFCGACEGGETTEEGNEKQTENEKCKDKSPHCARYGADRCKSSPGWMIPNCMKFCGSCNGGKNQNNEDKIQNDDNNDCKDKSPHCARYGTRECRNNPRWMIPNCRKFCRACEGNNNSDGKQNDQPKGDC